MAFNIGALLRDKLFPTLSGAALVGDPAPEPAGGVLPAPPAPPIGAAGGGPALPLPPEGVPEAAPPPPPVPEAYKSPPDLVEMYSKLMDKSRNAAAMDRGMTLIAAGFAQPQNREALIRAAYSGGSGGGGSSPSMSDILALQKYQTEQADVAARRAQLPMLMEKYKLDEATVKYLDATGQLDETIVKLADPETQVVEGSDGNKKLIDINTGETIKELSPAKPRPTEFIELGDGTKTLVYSDDKTEVATGKPITNIEAKVETEVIKDATGANVVINKNTGEVISTATPGKVNTEIVQDATGANIVINKDTGETIKTATEGKPRATEFIDQGDGRKVLVYSDDKTQVSTGKQITYIPPAPKPITIETMADGTKQAVQDGKPIGVPFGAAEDASTDDMKEIAQINEDEKKAGKPLTSLKDWILQRTKAGTEAGASAEADAQTAGTGAIIDQDIQDAIDYIEKGEAEDWIPPAGWGSLLSFIPESGPQALSSKLGPIRTTIGLDALKAMRAASKTGGALGSITEGEHRMLQQVEGSLDQSLAPEILVHNLRRVQVIRNFIVNGVIDATTGKPRPATEEEMRAAVNAIPRGLSGPGPDAEGKQDLGEGFKILSRKPKE